MVSFIPLQRCHWVSVYWCVFTWACFRRDSLTSKIWIAPPSWGGVAGVPPCGWEGGSLTPHAGRGLPIPPSPSPPSPPLWVLSGFLQRQGLGPLFQKGQRPVVPQGGVPPQRVPSPTWGAVGGEDTEQEQAQAIVSPPCRPDSTQLFFIGGLPTPLVLGKGGGGYTPSHVQKLNAISIALHHHKKLKHIQILQTCFTHEL